MKKAMLPLLFLTPVVATADSFIQSLGNPIDASLALIIAAGMIFGFSALKRKEI